MSERVAIVTGAARGIGAATALRLTADGFRVAALDLTEPDLPDALPVAADVTDPAQVAPGFIVSDMTKATAARIGEDWDTYVAARAAGIPVARAGQPEDVANAVAFFVGEAAGFVSRQVLYVAGGPKG